MKSSVTFLVFAAVGLWISWVFQAAILNLLGVTWNQEELGQWGDTFGALNALFASLGFGAAIYTLNVQQRQIARDRFDTSFFELLRLFVEARDRVSFSHTQPYVKAKTQSPSGHQNTSRLSFIRQANLASTARGIAAFQQAWLEVKFWVPNTRAPRENYIDAYEKYINSRTENTMGPYFRLLYAILKRIQDDEHLSESDKNKYGNLIRGQLSNYELAIAGLNGMSTVSKDFSKLAIRFRLFKYTTGVRRRLLMLHYPKIAFLPRG